MRIGADGNASGFSKEVYDLIKSRSQAGQSLSVEDVAKVEEAILADNQISASEMDLLDELLGDSVKINVSQGSSSFEVNTVSFVKQSRGELSQLKTRLQDLTSAQALVQRSTTPDETRSQLASLQRRLNGPNGLQAKLQHLEQQLAETPNLAPANRKLLQLQIQITRKEITLFQQVTTTLDKSLQTVEKAREANLRRLGLDQLSSSEKAAVDIDRDGQLSREEEDAALAAADLNGDRQIGFDEARVFRQLVSDDSSPDFLRQGVSDHITQEHQGLKDELREAQGESFTARKALDQAQVDVPDKPAAALEDEQQQLGSLEQVATSEQQLADQEKTRQETLSHLEQLQQELAQAEQTVAEVDKEHHQLTGQDGTVEQVQRYVDDLRTKVEGVPESPREILELIADLEDQLQQSPGDATLKSRITTLLEYARDPRQLEADRSLLAKEKTRLAGLKQEAGVHTRGTQSVARLKTEIQQTQAQLRQLPDAKAIAASRAQLGQTRLRLQELAVQIPLAKAQEKEWSLARQEASLRQLGEKASAKEQRLAEAEISTLVPALTEAEELLGRNASQAAKILKEGAAKAIGIKQAVESGKLDGDLVDIEKVDKAIATAEQHFAQLKADTEQQAQRLIDRLEDPTFQAALEALPDSQRAEVVGRALQFLAKTDTGKAYLEKKVVPAIQQLVAAAGAATPAIPPENPFWQTVFGATKDNYETSLKALEAVGGVLAYRAGGDQLVDGALRVALGLQSTEALHQVKTISDQVKRGILTETEAKGLLEKSHLGHLAHNLEKVTKVLTVIEFGLKTYELFHEPSVQSALEAGKSAAEVAGVIADLLKSNAKYASLAESAATVAGGAAAILEGTLSGIALWKDGGTIDYGDEGGTVGHTLILAGSGIFLAGLALDGTVVGGVAGVPLNVIGALIAGAGKVTNLFFEDGEGEKWLKDNAYEFLKQ